MISMESRFRVAITWFFIGELAGIVLAALAIAVLVKSIITQ